MSKYYFLNRSVVCSFVSLAAVLATSGAAIADPVTTIVANNDQPFVQSIGNTNAVRIRHLNLPKYSSAMVESGAEGVVEVEAHIDRSGHVTDATIARLDKPGLSVVENSVLESVRAATFYPSYADGEPTDSVVMLPFQFRVVDRTVSTFPFKRVAKSKIARND